MSQSTQSTTEQHSIEKQGRDPFRPGQHRMRTDGRSRRGRRAIGTASIVVAITAASLAGTPTGASARPGTDRHGTAQHGARHGQASKRHGSGHGRGDRRGRRGEPVSRGGREAPVSADRGERAVSLAASRAGSPYVYGGSGPSVFDCSGLTSWVYAQMGVALPRTSAGQAGAARRVSGGDVRRGDLVFFTGFGGVYHVAIYAGEGSVWHAPFPGASVRRERIWTSAVFFGRVG